MLVEMRVTVCCVIGDLSAALQVTSHDYILDMYDAEFCGEYDEVVTSDYGKCDHLKVPVWILDAHREAKGGTEDESPFRVLDLGCGTGMSGEALKEHGFEGPFTGVDISQKSLDWMQTNKPGVYAHTVKGWCFLNVMCDRL